MIYAIGIDIGATKIKGVLVRGESKILAREEKLTKAKRKKAAILAEILNIINKLKKIAKKRNFKIGGIGIGLPGTIKNGKLIFGGGTLSQFKNFNFKKYFEKESGFKVFLDNDSKCFALAESFFAAGKIYRRIAGIIWGTGIGAGIVDKKTYPRGRVYEIGHFVAEPEIKSEPKCGCGKRGCVENLASGKNIVRRYYKMGGKIKNAGVREIYFSKEAVAKEVLEDAYRYLGWGIANLVNAYKPDIVIIGGGVSNLPAPAHQKVKKYIYQYLGGKKGKGLKITKSRIGNFSGALGAAKLVFRK